MIRKKKKKKKNALNQSAKKKKKNCQNEKEKAGTTNSPCLGFSSCPFILLFAYSLIAVNISYFSSQPKLYIL